MEVGSWGRSGHGGESVSEAGWIMKVRLSVADVNRKHITITGIHLTDGGQRPPYGEIELLVV